MSIGMTYDEFWNEDCNRAIAYRKANYMRIERRNEEMWLQGLYNYHAFGCVLGEAFRKKGDTPRKYMEKPLSILPKTGAELKKEREEERKKAVDAFTAWANTWNQKHK